jgi:hypothetical protein
MKMRDEAVCYQVSVIQDVSSPSPPMPMCDDDYTLSILTDADED